MSYVSSASRFVMHYLCALPAALCHLTASPLYDYTAITTSTPQHLNTSTPHHHHLTASLPRHVATLAPFIGPMKGPHIVNSAMNRGATPLYVAAHNGHAESIRIMAKVSG